MVFIPKFLKTIKSATLPQRFNVRERERKGSLMGLSRVRLPVVAKILFDVSFLFRVFSFLFIIENSHGNSFWWFRTCEWRSLRYLFTCVVTISFTRIPQELYKGAVYSSRIRKVSPVFEAEIDILKAPSRTRWLRINWRMYYGIWKQLSRAAHLHLNQR